LNGKLLEEYWKQLPREEFYMQAREGKSQVMALEAVSLCKIFVNVRLLWINFILGLNFIFLSFWLNE